MKSLILGLLVLSTSAFAGKEGGNGGGVHLCPQRNSIEVYDLYEGFTRYNVPLPQITDRPIQEYLTEAVTKIYNSNPKVGSNVERALNYLIQEDHFLIRDNVRLDLIDDANILIVDEGCSYGQIANWDNVSGNVIVDGKLFAKLNNLNKAALYLHEAVYYQARRYWGARDSTSSRRLTAEALGSRGNFSFIGVDNGVKFNEQASPAEVQVSKTDKIITIKNNLGDADFYSSNVLLKVSASLPNAQKQLEQARNASQAAYEASNRANRAWSELSNSIKKLQRGSREYKRVSKLENEAQQTDLRLQRELQDSYPPIYRAEAYVKTLAFSNGSFDESTKFQLFNSIQGGGPENMYDYEISIEVLVKGEIVHSEVMKGNVKKDRMEHASLVYENFVNKRN